MHKLVVKCWCAFAFLLFLSIVTVAQTVPAELYNGLRWRLIGPFRAGREVAVAGVPGGPDHILFWWRGWRRLENLRMPGTVWTPISDGQRRSDLVGALAVAPSDSNTIYVGTGESDIRSSLSSAMEFTGRSMPVVTWTHIGVDDTRHISRIVVDPQDANIVYVGALGHTYASNEARGVYKSTDGGEHWTKVLDQGPETGVSDLAIC